MAAAPAQDLATDMPVQGGACADEWVQKRAASADPWYSAYPLQTAALDTTTPRHSLNLQLQPGSDHVSVSIGGLPRRSSLAHAGSLAHSGSLAGSLPQSSGHLERQHSGLGNFGRFGLPHHRSTVLSQSALLTGMVGPFVSTAAGSWVLIAE